MKQKIERLRSLLTLVGSNAGDTQVLSASGGLVTDQHGDRVAAFIHLEDAQFYTEAVNALPALLSHIDALVEFAGSLEKLAAEQRSHRFVAERALAEAVKERDALRSASTIIRERDEAVEVLGVARIALLYARDTFSHYELQHLDKQTPEGNAKADANARHANHMSQALATISKITGEEGAGAFLTKMGEK